MISPSDPSPRYIILSETLGVLLGTHFGSGFWSKIEPLWLNCATTFGSKEEIMEFASEWAAYHDLPPDLTFPAVYPDGGNYYASMDVCVAAGAQPWDASLVTLL